MGFKKGFCQLKYKKGYYEFGEIIKINSESIIFMGYSPSSKEKEILFSEIEAVEYLKEEDIPPYE